MILLLLFNCETFTKPEGGDQTIIAAEQWIKIQKAFQLHLNSAQKCCCRWNPSKKRSWKSSSTHYMKWEGASHPDHFQFRRRAIRDCKAYMSKISNDNINYQAISALKFPKNYNDAYQHVLRNEDMPDIVGTYSDKLESEGYEPYFRRFDQRTGNFNGYTLKQEFKAYLPSQLDPLNRFTFNRCSKEEKLFNEWFLADDDSMDGLVFEAVLACHALQAESCHNCKYKNALRWNGGSGSSWQDLVCTNCEATYEIKTKATIEKVETALRYKIQGGSFSAWCELKNRATYKS